MCSIWFILFPYGKIKLQRSCLLFFLTFVMVNPEWNALSLATKQIVNFNSLTCFQGSEEDAGRIGLMIVVAGMLGSVCGGLLLDKTGKFK